MKIEKYGVVLSRLTEQEIEQVRVWRNDPKISQYLLTRDEITPEMQQKWFHNLDTATQYYFIIQFQNEPVGLINMKNIDWTTREGEYGIFIADDDQLHSLVPYQAVLALHDFAFEELQLARIQAHILNWNKRAIRFNKSLGYRLADGQSDLENQLYVLHADEYDRCSAPYKKTILRAQRESIDG